MMNLGIAVTSPYSTEGSTREGNDWEGEVQMKTEHHCYMIKKTSYRLEESAVMTFW